MAEALDRLIRCPACLAPHRAPRAAPLEERVQCSACRETFKLVHGLASRAEETEESLRSVPPIRPAPRMPAFWNLAAPGFLGGAGLGISMGREIRGPTFLALYLALFLVLWIGSTIVRHAWMNATAVSTIACLAFLGTGIGRVVVGISQGMHQFGFLACAMVLGSLLFFLRLSHLQAWGPRGGTGGSCGGWMATGCSGGGGGGCGGGGGGCGGGGCGGCGGS
ncbi:MAG TPA: hypothetical protein VKF62_06880 [Planctomycetota bacterium]|nr:hypothetical protein [Planctomycetota bacterium]